MPLPPRLEHEIRELQNECVVNVYEDSTIINLVLSDFPLGPGYNAACADLLIRVPRTYPDSGPDMFWMDPRVLLANGQEPQAANAIEMHIGRRWRRFSWHRTGWNGTVENLASYIHFIQARLAQKH